MKPRRLSTLLASMLWLGMAPLFLLAIWLAWSSLREQDARLVREGENVAKSYATSVDQFLRARITGLDMLAASPLSDDPRSWDKLYAEALVFRKSYDTQVIFADTAGQMRFNTRAPFGTRLPPLPVSKGRSAAPLAIETALPQVGDIVQGPLAKVPLVAIAVPGVRDGQVTHLLLTTLETTQLKERLDGVAMPLGWSLALVDGTGADIARRAPPGFVAGDAEADHRFRVPLELSPWSVELEIPRDAQWTLQRRAMLTLGTAIALALLIGLLAGTRAARHLSRQMASLTTPDSPTALAPDIEELAEAKALLDRARAAEQASSERFARLFAQAPVPMSLAGTDGRLLMLNSRFEQLFGYSPAELPDLEHLLELAYPDPIARERIRTDWTGDESRAEPDGHAPPPRQNRITCKDGRQVDILLSRIVLKDGVLSSFVDITALKRSEQELAVALEQQKSARLAALNQMEDANAARRQVQELNANLERHVVERTAELSAANQELDAFAYAVSHDLRAPLRAMIGFSQALQEDHAEQLQGDASNYLDQIIIASRRMSDLIDGLLALSRSTRGELQRDLVDLSALASRHAAELARAEPDREVRCEIEPGLVARGDARMLDAVIANLLGNAWKYTSKTTGPVVRVTRGELSGQPAFSVSDNGAGFDMSHAERLFKPFQRMHRQDEFPGIGIGLATVQRIIHRHGGTIMARSTPGQGATFLFTLADHPVPEDKA